MIKRSRNQWIKLLLKKLKNSKFGEEKKGMSLKQRLLTITLPLCSWAAALLAERQLNLQEKRKKDQAMSQKLKKSCCMAFVNAMNQ